MLRMLLGVGVGAVLGVLILRAGQRWGVLCGAVFGLVLGLLIILAAGGGGLWR